MQENFNDLLLRIRLLEKHCEDIEKKISKLESAQTISIEHIQLLKEQSMNGRTFETIDNRVSHIEEELDTIRMELPEIRLVKQLFFALIAFVLMGVVGLLWNSITPEKKQDDSEMTTAIEKVLSQYEKRKQ